MKTESTSSQNTLRFGSSGQHGLHLEGRQDREILWDAQCDTTHAFDGSELHVAVDGGKRDLNKVRAM